MPSDWTFNAVDRLHNRINDVNDDLSTIFDSLNSFKGSHNNLVGSHNALFDSHAKLCELFNARDTISRSFTYSQIASMDRDIACEIHDNVVANVHLDQLSRDVVKGLEEQRPKEIVPEENEEATDQSFSISTNRHIVHANAIAINRINCNIRDAYAEVHFREFAKMQKKLFDSSDVNKNLIENTFSEMRKNYGEHQSVLENIKIQVQHHETQMQKNTSAFADLLQRLLNVENFSGVTHVHERKAPAEVVQQERMPGSFPVDIPHHEVQGVSDPVKTSEAQSHKSLSLQLAGIQRSLTLLQASFEGLREDVSECQLKNDDFDRRLRKVEVHVQSQAGSQALVSTADLSRINPANPFARFEAHRKQRMAHRDELPSSSTLRAYLTNEESETQEM